MRVFIHASDVDTVRSVMREAEATGCEVFPFAGRVVGYIDLPGPAKRQVLRNDSRVNIIPHKASPADVSTHGKALGLQSAKTARDIYAAVFAATNADLFDPDL